MSLKVISKAITREASKICRKDAKELNEFWPTSLPFEELSVVGDLNLSDTTLSDEVRHVAQNYCEASVAIKQKLRLDVMNVLKSYINPDLEIPLVRKMHFEDWSHCFNVVYTNSLNSRINSSVFRLNGNVISDFKNSSLKELSIADRYAFDQFKERLKFDTSNEVGEIRKIVHIAVCDFLGIIDDSDGLTCTESFQKEFFNDFRGYVAKAVHVSGGDLTSMSSLAEATGDVVPLLNTGNGRYNKSYLTSKRLEAAAKGAAAKATLDRRKLASAITVERRTQAAVTTKIAPSKNLSSGCKKAPPSPPAPSVKRQKIVVEKHETPTRNSEDVDNEISKLFEVEEYMRDSLYSDGKPIVGDFKQQCMLLTKKVTYDFRNCVGGKDSLFTVENVMVYLHHLFKDVSDEIFNNLYDSNEANPFAKFTPLHNNSEKPSQNDYLRRSANASYKGNKRLRDVIENIKCLLLRDKIVHKNTFFTSGSGEAFSITLLLALVNCKRQQDHFDYDPVLYAPNEDYDGVDDKYVGSYLNYNGASMFINFSWVDWQSLDLDEWDMDLKGEHKKLWMRPMSILIINGNLKHAGSNNKSGKVTRKFFMYLDPCLGSRKKFVTSENGKISADNHIFFDQYFRKDC
jgi:hypothetical protein